MTFVRQINLTAIVLLLCSVLFLVYFQLKAPSVLQQKQILIPPPAISHFTFGYSELMADSFWIRAIQDIDYCEQNKVMPNGDKSRDCIDEGWVYRMLDLITDLAPQFRIVYATGPISLSVIVSDIKGASLLFDKAVKAFPADWPILYRAGYHAWFEEKNPEKAAALLARAARSGAPKWLYSFAGGIYGAQGQIEVAEKLLQEMKDAKADEILIKKLEDKIAKFKANQNK